MEKLIKALSISALSSIAFTSCAIANSNIEENTGKFSALECYFPELKLAKDFVVYAASDFADYRLDWTIEDSSNKGALLTGITVNSPSKPVVVIVSNNDPSIWRFDWTEDTEIIGVLATGYYRQAIAGLPQETPIKTVSIENEDKCGYIDPTKDLPHSELSLQALSKTIFGQEVEQFYYSEEEVIGEPIAEEYLKPEKLLRSDDTTVTSFSYEPSSSKTGRDVIAEEVAKGHLRLATEEDINIWLEAQKELQPELDLHPIPPHGCQNISGYLQTEGAERYYVVTSEEFAYPPGLYGAEAAYFFIPKGMSKPEGNFGHSAVYDNSKGTCKGNFCIYYINYKNSLESNVILTLKSNKGLSSFSN